MDCLSGKLLIVEEEIGRFGSSPSSLSIVIRQVMNRQLQSVSMQERRKIRSGAINPRSPVDLIGCGAGFGVTPGVRQFEKSVCAVR